MKLENSVAINKKYNESLINVGKVVLEKLCYFLAGTIISHGTVLDNYSPFGAAYLAAIPYNDIWVSLFGCIVGYIVPSKTNSAIRYIATILAVAAIRWALNDLKKINRSSFYASFVAIAPILATGIAMGTVEGFTSTTVVMIITEGLLAFAGAYFFSKTSLLLSGSKVLTTFNYQELICVSMAACITLLSFSDVSVKGISLGRILAMVIILLCANCGGITAGCVAGVASGVIFSLASTQFSFLAGAYSFGGMMAGLFSPLGTFFTIVAFTFCNSVITFQTSDMSIIITELYEILIATAIFIFIPTKISNNLTDLFYNKANKVSVDSLRRSLIMRLESSSNAISSVSESVNSVSQKLNKLDKPDINIIYKKSISSVCNHCGLKVFCWDKERDDTKKYFNNISKILQHKGNIMKQDVPEEFISRCCKNSQMIKELNSEYNEFIIKQAADKRLEEFRKILSEQFCQMGEILEDIVKDFKEAETFDTTTEERIYSSIKNIGIIPRDVSCKIDKFDRMFIEIEASITDKSRINKSIIAKEISNICNREMDFPCITYSCENCNIQISEKPLLELNIGASQHICESGKLCGDSYSYFNDGLGHTIAIISDGMGTGGRAAIDAAITTDVMSKLIKCGLSFNCALKIINSALLVKSGEESLSTLDIIYLDLFSGKTEFLKAGAAITFIKTKGKIITVDTPSLPAGILSNISFSNESMNLDVGDTIIMLSDGALATGDNWIKELLKNSKESDPKLLSSYILNEAINRRNDGHDDDITVLAIKICENKY